MTKYIKPLLIMLLGLWITNIGLQMSMAQVVSTDTQDTRGRNAAVGAGLGAGGGIVTGLIVGGIGIVTCGTGFAIGLPVMALLGAGCGALAGAATGTVTTVKQSDSLYSPLAWGAIIIVGVLVALNGMKQFRSLRGENVERSA
jgi:hypothetical protein